MAIKQCAQKLLWAINYAFYLVLFIVAFDVLILHHLLGYGYPRHYEEENILRYPAPYVAFTGKPSVQGHNEFGFRGPSFKEAGPDAIRVAFFGGSTGYFGKPSIAKVVERHLKEQLGTDVFVANYSVVSSNHRQHLHGILEYLPVFKPDLVIFYGGYNETVQSGYFDPRPGYPFNYFYRSDTSTFCKLLLEYSAIIGEIDKTAGVFSGIHKLRMQQQPFSEPWNGKIVQNYFDTLRLAKTVAGTIGSERLGSTRFLAFYQPYRVPERFASTHEKIRKHIDTVEYVFDVSSEYDGLGEQVYTDTVHVNQEARERMGVAIAKIVAGECRESTAETNHQ